MFKRLMRSNAAQALIGGLVALWMSFVKYTTRWEVIDESHAETIITSGDGFIALTFHSRVLLLTSAWKRRYEQQPHVLISRSRDGGIVAWTCRWLGMSVVRGSAKNANKSKAKGGQQAGREMLDVIARRDCIVITPDGPRGPRQRVPVGPLRLARMSGAPLLPCMFAVSHRKQFKSWDRFVLPLPFGRGRIIWGTPVHVDRQTDDDALEALRRAIETDMNALLTNADRAMGHNPVEPG